MSVPEEIEAVCLLGWRVYPASRRTKAARFTGASSAATYDLNIVAQWCREYGPSNWRVVMAGSGIWAMDVDAPGIEHSADGVAVMKGLVEKNGPIPPRPMTRSGGGGYAMFFAHRGEKISGKTGTPSAGLDPRRGNLSVTIPPSIHVVTRSKYFWLSKPWEVNPPAAPAWLLSLVEPPPEPAYQRDPIDTTDAARRTLYRAAIAVMDSVNGERNDVLNRRSYQAGRMIAAGLLGEGEAVNALYGAARQAGLDHAESQATIRSGIQSGRRRWMTT